MNNKIKLLHFLHIKEPFDKTFKKSNGKMLSLKNFQKNKKEKGLFLISCFSPKIEMEIPNDYKVFII